MKKISILFCIGMMIWGLQGCNPYNPSVYRGFPKTYSTAYQEIYGHCYDSLSSAVVALDLYDGIELDKDHRIKGTGYNLYLSDIFVPDSMLVEGTYRSSDSGEPFTFLPGKSYEGTPTGIYILRIEEDKIAQIQVVDSGSFVYRNDSLLFTLYYRNAYGYKYQYTSSFSGALIPWLKK